MTLIPSPTAHAWAALWRSKNKLNGVTEHFVHDNLLPILFPSRKQARRWIETWFGYIRTRPDLRNEPNGWQMPKAVRVTITLNTKKPTS